VTAYFFKFSVYDFLPIAHLSFLIQFPMSMGDPIQAMNDLTCVKEIIQALAPEKQKELFEQFVPYIT
jgi:hypothetical protein